MRRLDLQGSRGELGLTVGVAFTDGDPRAPAEPKTGDVRRTAGTRCFWMSEELAVNCNAEKLALPEQRPFVEWVGVVQEDLVGDFTWGDHFFGEGSRQRNRRKPWRSPRTAANANRDIVVPFLIGVSSLRSLSCGQQICRTDLNVRDSESSSNHFSKKIAKNRFGRFGRSVDQSRKTALLKEGCSRFKLGLLLPQYREMAQDLAAATAAEAGETEESQRTRSRNGGHGEFGEGQSATVTEVGSGTTEGDVLTGGNGQLGNEDDVTGVNRASAGIAVEVATVIFPGEARTVHQLAGTVDVVGEEAGEEEVSAA